MNQNRAWSNEPLEAETTRGEMAQNKYEVTTYKG
jgi:hypothetical protein